MAESPQPISRSRMWIVRVLVALGVIFGIIALLAGYVRWQVFDEDTFRTTSEELIADDTVRDQVGTTLVESLFGNVDVAARLEQRLPAEQQGLAAPLAGAFRELADRAAVRLLERPRVQEAWVNSTVTAQRQLERLLDDKTTALRTEGGYLVLNLRPIVVQLGDRVAIAGRVDQLLPEDAGVVRIMEVDKLETAQDLTKLFKQVAPVVPFVPLVLFGLAIWLARGRRRQAVRMVGIGFVLMGLIVLAARGIAGSYIVDELVVSETVKPAASDAWDILTSLLADGAWSVIGAGVVLVLGTWVAGPSRRAGMVRSRIAPYLAQPEYAYGGAALFLLLIVWWGPTAQTRRWFWILLVAILLALAVEALRRAVARLEPAATSEPSEEPTTVVPEPTERSP